MSVGLGVQVCVHTYVHTYPTDVYAHVHMLIYIHTHIHRYIHTEHTSHTYMHSYPHAGHIQTRKSRLCRPTLWRTKDALLAAGNEILGDAFAEIFDVGETVYLKQRGFPVLHALMQE